jgi:hypothetical protein
MMTSCQVWEGITLLGRGRPRAQNDTMATPDRAEDLEGLFHLFFGNRPDPGIIDALIRRSAEGQSMRHPSNRKDRP